MSSEIYIIKVNKKGFQEKLKYDNSEVLTSEDMQEIKEDEVTSFINVFERYFEKKEIFYEYGRYFEITLEEISFMMKFLERRLSLACDKTDWYFRMSELIYNKLNEWKDRLDDSTLLFRQDMVN